jgi:hypothetical protein
MNIYNKFNWIKKVYFYFEWKSFKVAHRREIPRSSNAANGRLSQIVASRRRWPVDATQHARHPPTFSIPVDIQKKSIK